ncbi:unnamed protein product, partial [Callosobruchus maculatus]
ANCLNSQLTNRRHRSDAAGTRRLCRGVLTCDVGDICVTSSTGINKNIEKYKGERQHENLKAFVEQMMQPDGISRESGKITDLPPDPISVGELTADTFKLGVGSGLSFVKFFAPWCGHCKRLSPIWDNLAEKFGKTNDVHISKVDCTLTANKQLCNDENIEGFPTLILYRDGIRISEYSGTRTLEDLSDFVSKHLERHDEL